MSQRSRRSQAKHLNDSSESLSQSRMSQASSSRGNRTISPSSQDHDSQDYQQYTVATVKFILNHLAAKYPIKRADLVKECCNGNGRHFAVILPTVQRRLETIYGIVLHEVTSIKGSNKQYICFATSPSVSMIKMKKCDRRQQTLLTIILSYIFTKGVSVGEGVLMNFLERLDIDIDREHEYFGDVKKCLETFRKQLYLKREKKQSEASNEEKITIEWGERALMEFDKKTMLINIAEVFHKPTLYFKKQHMELMVGEEESMDVDA